MSAESIRIINAAISRSTGNTITSVDDASPEAIYANLNYEQIVETELEGAPWNFARDTDDCTALPDAPVDARYSNLWQLPDGVLKLRTILLSGYSVDYRIDSNGKVMVNADDGVEAVFTIRAAETTWPGDFTEGITLRLEAGFLRLDERTAEADGRETRADKQFQKAKLVHAQEEKPHDPRKFPLVNVRRIGARASRHC